MCEVASAGQVQAHDAVVWLQQRCVGCKVGRAAWRECRQAEQVVSAQKQERQPSRRHTAS
jgi:hypothetical protein